MAWKYHVTILYLVTALTIKAEFLNFDRRAMDDKFQVLSNEHEQMNRKLNLLLKLEGVDTGENPAAAWPLLTLMNISREGISEAGWVTQVKYTLWYRNKGHYDDVSVEWTSRYQESSEHLPETRSGGSPDGDSMIWSTSVVADYKPVVGEICVHITHLGSMLTYTVHFYNDYRTDLLNQQARNIPMNTVEVLNEGGVVYNDWEDPVLKLKTHFSTIDPYDTTATKVDIELINSTSNKRLAEKCEWDDFDSERSLCRVLPGRKKFRNYMEYEVALLKDPDLERHTDSLIISGFITLTVETKDISNFIYITTQLVVEVRPRSQAGPYPDNFLEVNIISKGDDSSQHCQYNRDDCPVKCEARGNNLQNIEIVKQLSEGATEELDIEVVMERHSHMIQASANVVKPANISDKDTYTCVATKKDGETARDSVNVDNRLQLAIDNNETYALYNGTTLKVVCVVEGYPISWIEIDLLEHGWLTSVKIPSSNLTLERDPQNLRLKATGFVETYQLFDVVCSAASNEFSPLPDVQKKIIPKYWY